MANDGADIWWQWSIVPKFNRKWSPENKNKLNPFHPLKVTRQQQKSMRCKHIRAKKNELRLQKQNLHENSVVKSKTLIANKERGNKKRKNREGEFEGVTWSLNAYMFVVLTIKGRDECKNWICGWIKWKGVYVTELGAWKEEETVRRVWAVEWRWGKADFRKEDSTVKKGKKIK